MYLIELDTHWIEYIRRKEEYRREFLHLRDRVKAEYEVILVQGNYPVKPLCSLCKVDISKTYYFISKRGRYPKCKDCVRSAVRWR